MKLGILLFAIANVIVWFQFNSQFVWKWFQDKPVTINLMLAVPAGIIFWYAVRSVVTDTGELWASKMVGFGVGNIIFATMTWFLMKESMFTTKTMICMFLACLIIATQVFWK